MKIFWTRCALDDLARIHDHIAVERPAAGADVAARIENTAALLARHPNIGRPGRVDGTRELVVPGTSFIVVYRAEGDRVDILAVVHAARQWPDVL